MVEFCQSCKTSLPKADLTVRNGEVFASPDYLCPFCNRPANPDAPGEPAKPLPDAKHDVVIRDGESAPAEPEEAPGG